MKNKIICMAFVILLIACCAYSGFSGALREKEIKADYDVLQAEHSSTTDLFENMLPAAADPAAPSDEKTQPPEEAADDRGAKNSWTLSFAGDCTIGTLHEWQHSGGSNNMLSVIGSDYAYPFKNVVSYFINDDLTVVNLEGTFTESADAKSKDYRFRASPVYAQVLTEGSIEAVSIANNHTGDYYDVGLADTKEVLDRNGVLWASSEKPIIYELEDGPKIGIVAYNMVEIDLAVGDVEAYVQHMGTLYEDCWKSGCDIIICVLHWGWEYTQAPEVWMTELAHRLVDMGFSMVIGGHSHIVQEMEYYNGAPIFYSLGNFCYGGHSGPADKDSVIVRQKIVHSGDGGYRLGTLELVPCSISTTEEKNDFCPMPYEKDSDGWLRVVQKLKADGYTE